MENKKPCIKNKKNLHKKNYSHLFDFETLRKKKKYTI
jgi:hypothetical protein